MLTRTKRKRTELPARYTPGFIREMDCRQGVAQRLLAAYDTIVADAGGAELPHTKLALIERFVFLEAAIQSWEQEIANNPTANEALLSRWVQAVNSMQGLAKLIGLTRSARVVDLRSYVQEQEADE